MGLAETRSRLTVEEYLEGEQTSGIRHEYVDGQVFAMAGASANHNRVARNLVSHLTAHLANTPCEAFVSDMKVRANDVFYYPDVMVCCDPNDNDRFFRDYPRLLVEVVSPSTMRTDYYEKRLAYQKIPTLQQYIIVDPDRVLVDVFDRDSAGHWVKRTLLQLSDVLNFVPVSLALPLLEVYRNVVFEERVELST
jgi:Uma2 family endonuclease